MEARIAQGDSLVYTVVTGDEYSKLCKKMFDIVMEGSSGLILKWFINNTSKQKNKKQEVELSSWHLFIYNLTMRNNSQNIFLSEN